MGLSIDESKFDSLFDGISNFYEDFLQQQKENHKLVPEVINQASEVSEQEMIAQALKSPCRGILIGDYAKLLKNLNISIGQNVLFRWLRNNKYLDKRNVPYQRYVEMGLFVIKEVVVVSRAGNFTRYTTKITAKGQYYFAKKLLNERHGMDE